jgi:hypothetical protein
MKLFFIPLFFMAAEIFFLLHHRFFYYYLQVLPRLFNRISKRTRVIILSKDIFIFLGFYLIRLFFFAYCFYIVFFTETWEPGCMLLLISALTQMAVLFRIDGVSWVEKTTGLVFPNRFFQTVMSSTSIFILAQFAIQF